MNRVEISGNLGADPELRATAGGTSVASLRVCVSSRQKGQDGQWRDVPNWVGVTVWGGQADACSRHLSKGSRVWVSGRLRESVWEKDGQRHSKLEVVADEVEWPPTKGVTQDDREDAYDEDIPF